ncbi:MAG: type II toxin-antitoxin system VapC family toxin [Promethearchaeota archaeon]|nr:MAG: type II toxin-antitoxin system VapC family toxin [Candidatus Lokiarchaeota archaeon]
MVLLDTDILIKFLRNDPSAVKKLSKLIEHHLIISTTSINIAELYFGAYLSEKKEENLNAVKELILKLEIISFNQNHSEIYGEIRANLQKKGELINELDIFIASIAIEREIKLITRNIKHYEKIDKLQIESW